MFFEIEGITKRYGGLVANNSISGIIEEREIVGLIGPNGAGKSTLFKIITGFLLPNSGQVRFKGKDITGHSPQKICRSGISCTFQQAKIFPELDVFESILAGAYCRRSNKRDAMKSVEEILAFVGLVGFESKRITQLNMFNRKKVELAAAYATSPQLLLLDELFAGCTPTEVEELLQLIKKINCQGIALFIVEHVLKVIMSVCMKIMVLDNGEIIEVGSPEVITTSPRVISAYLGEDYDAS